MIGFDPLVSSEQCQQFNTEKLELDEIWPLADYITLHTPLLDSTRRKYICVYYYEVEFHRQPYSRFGGHN